MPQPLFHDVVVVALRFQSYLHLCERSDCGVWTWVSCVFEYIQSESSTTSSVLGRMHLTIRTLEAEQTKPRDWIVRVHLEPEQACTAVSVNDEPIFEPTVVLKQHTGYFPFQDGAAPLAGTVVDIPVLQRASPTAVVTAIISRV